MPRVNTPSPLSPPHPLPSPRAGSICPPRPLYFKKARSRDRRMLSSSNVDKRATIPDSSLIPFRTAKMRGKYEAGSGNWLSLRIKEPFLAIRSRVGDDPFRVLDGQTIQYTRVSIHVSPFHTLSLSLSLSLSSHHELTRVSYLPLTGRTRASHTVHTIISSGQTHRRCQPEHAYARGWRTQFRKQSAAASWKRWLSA